jgi:spore coat protein A
MSITRRRFLRASGLSAAGLALRVRAAGRSQEQKLALDLTALAPFVTPLPMLQTAKSVGRQRQDGRDVPLYRMAMRQVEARVHRDLAPTRFWSFGSTFPGPTFDTRTREGLAIEWVNELPKRHVLPIDHTLHGAEADTPEVRAVVHVHGAKVPSESDGQSDRWIVPGQSARYYYPNAQHAATLWYHDHTMGINRLNVYAGLMGVYLIRDEIEDALNLPKGLFEIPLLFCDRLFDADAQLDYPTSDDPDAPWVPEVFGEAMLINGALWPYCDVERRRYRFRMINGSNGRFLHLTLPNGLPFCQIGADQGLLDAPVEVTRLDLAPAERADIVIDFSGQAGNSLNVANDGQPIMQFRVARAPSHDASALPELLRAVPRLREADAVETRFLTLAEDDDLLARPTRMLLNGARWHMPVTEQPVLDSTEIWSLANLTDDTHPIHLHLVGFQILDRRKFDVFVYLKERRVVFTGPVVLPQPGEAGWKDTVRADAGMITRIIVRFDGYAGRYMWHCHILEHGDNEMMRPYEVVRLP